jgi:hypothetical protein
MHHQREGVSADFYLVLFELKCVSQDEITFINYNPSTSINMRLNFHRRARFFFTLYRASNTQRKTNIFPGRGVILFKRKKVPAKCFYAVCKKE